MDKKNNITQIYKSIDKVLNKLIAANAKDYLKYHKNKPWYTIALKGYEKATRGMLELLKEYSKKYGEAIEGKKIFKKKIKKADDEDDNIEELINDIDDIIDNDYAEITDDDIREIIEEVTEELLEELEEFYDNEIKDNTIINAAEIVANDIGLKFNFNQYNKLTRDYLRDKKIEWAEQVAETTEKRVKELLVKGYEEGLSSYDIAELIYDDYLFGYNRAEMIVRTEIVAACNYADFSIYKLDDNIYGKKWSATGDDRTRFDHALADGQVKKIDEPFSVGGDLMMYPLDGSLGASAGNIVNCRCTVFYLTKEEYEKEMGSFRTLQIF